MWVWILDIFEKIKYYQFEFKYLDLDLWYRLLSYTDGIPNIIWKVTNNLKRCEIYIFLMT